MPRWKIRSVAKRLPPTHRLQPSERGYALISALWLLLLAAVLAGALTAHSVTRARAVAQLRAELLLELRATSAIESAMADIVFNGNQSAIGQNSGAVAYHFGGRDIAVRASSERNRIDINDAPVELVDAALRRAQIGAELRGRVLSAIAARRAERRRFASLADIDRAVADDDGSGANACLLDVLTVAGGRSSPAPEGAPPLPPLLDNGAAVRLHIVDGGYRFMAVVQQSSSQRTPIGLLERMPAAGCN